MSEDNIRVNELAKLLNLNNKEILEKFAQLSIPIKAHSSTVTQDQVQRLKDFVSAGSKIEVKKPKAFIVKKAKIEPVEGAAEDTVSETETTEKHKIEVVKPAPSRLEIVRRAPQRDANEVKTEGERPKFQRPGQHQGQPQGQQGQRPPFKKEFNREGGNKFPPRQQSDFRPRPDSRPGFQKPSDRPADRPQTFERKPF